MHQESNKKANTKKLHSAPGNAKQSEIAIIDQRVILRDAIADSVRPTLGYKVLTTDTADSLINTPFTTGQASSQIIVLCDGGIEIDTAKQELEKLREFFPKSKRIVLTDNSRAISYRDYSNLGVKGIIPSFYNKEQFIACIKAIEVDIEYFPPYLFEFPCKENSNRINPDTCNRLSDILTPRQSQIMDFIAIGRSNKYVAAELSLSESTVKVHVHNIMKHLGATNRTHATHIINEMHEREMRVCSTTEPTDEADTEQTSSTNERQ